MAGFGVMLHAIKTTKQNLSKLRGKNLYKNLEARNKSVTRKASKVYYQNKKQREREYLIAKIVVSIPIVLFILFIIYSIITYEY